MKKLLLILMTFLVAPAGAATPHPTELSAGMVNPGYEEKPAWFKESFLDIREDVAEAAQADKRVLLYFYQDGCPYCTKLLKDNFGNRDIVDRTRRHFDVVAINMWGDREVTDFQGRPTTEKAFAAALRVQYTPTLLFLQEEGKVLLRVNGYFPPHKFGAAVDYAGNRLESKESFRDYYARLAPEPVSGKLHTEGDALPHPLRLGDNRRTSPRPLVVMFEQHACKACDELHEDILRRPEVGHALTNLDVAIVDLWSREPVQTPGGKEMTVRAWAKELNVNYAPSLVFFDTSGKEVFRTEAYLKSFHTHGALDYVATGAYGWQPNFQRWLQHRTEALRARGFEVDLMQ